MNKMIQKATIVLGVALFAFTSCKKENVNTIAAATDETTLISQAGTDMDNVGVFSDDNTAAIYMDDNGIAADFLVEETDADLISGAAGGNGPDDSMRKRIQARSFIRCIHGLNLNDKQKTAIRMALKDYAGCKESAIKRARAIYEEMQKVYKAKAEKLVQSYKDGKITKAQLESGMKELREAFRTNLRAKHLAEKLDDALKGCFREFLGKLHKNLSEEQWKNFVKCHKR